MKFTIDPKIRIVADSGADIFSMPGVDFYVAPLKIITAQQQYVDNAELNVRKMVDDLQSYSGKSTTSCPNVVDWLMAFGDAEEVYCATITGTLSGSYNAAVQAKAIYEEKYPGRKVFVLNSLSAGPEMKLHLEKIVQLIRQGLDFETICEEVTQYTEKTGLLFMLESIKNLTNNGRVSPLVAKMLGVLGIRLVGTASEKGDLKPLSKCRGEAKALDSIVAHMKEMGFIGGKVHIDHCFNEEAAKMLQKRLHKEFEKVQVTIAHCRGLCSFYAEKGGMLIGFEKNLQEYYV